MNKKIIIALVAVLIIVGVIYFATSKNTPSSVTDGSANTTHGEAIGSDTDHTSVVEGATLAGTRIILKNTTLKSGNQTIAFELYGKDGHAFGDAELKIAHEKKMHFILASNDFSDYQHVHPEFKDKTWQTDVTLKNNSGYQAYVDIESDEDGTETLRFPMAVGTPTSVSKVSQKETTLLKDGINVKMNAENGFVVGAENKITFTVTQNNKVVAPENYLGAKGHVVALGDDPNTFIHGHPDDHGDSEIHFAFAFDKTGTYTLFAQFKVSGVVRTYPFTISVGNATSADESKPHTDIVPHN